MGDLGDYGTLVHYCAVGFKALEELRQLGAGKRPLQRSWRLVREFFVESQTLCDFRKTGNVVGREDLAVHDRKVDFHLVEPTGMHRSVHHNHLGIGLDHPAGGRGGPSHSPGRRRQREGSCP